MKSKLFLVAVLVAELFVNFSYGGKMTKKDFAEKLKTARTVQMSSRRASYYDQDRSAESVASEIEVNGFDGVYLTVADERKIEPELIEEFHKRDIAVGALFFASGIYSPKDIFPEGWEKWRMEFTVPKPKEHIHLSFVYPEFVQWYKKRIVKILSEFDFDGFTFAEAHYPVYDGIEKDPINFGDISKGFQSIFKKETSNEHFPNFSDPNDPHYFRTDTRLYKDLVDFRVKTIVDFYDEVVNGKGGIRENFPDILVVSWSLAVDIENGPAKLREWEGNDTAMMVRQVRPDIHFLQTHWPDWIKPESELPADYAKNYAPYIKQIKAASPNVLVGIQADVGSLDCMRKSSRWYKDFIKGCDENGIDSTTYCVWNKRGEVYQNEPVLKKATSEGNSELKLHFDQYLDDSNGQLVKGKEIHKKGSSLTYKIKEGLVNGSILVLSLDKEVNIGDRLIIPIGGICDVPKRRLTPQSIAGRVNSIPAGTNLEIQIEKYPQ